MAMCLSMDVHCMYTLFFVSMYMYIMIGVYMSLDVCVYNLLYIRRICRHHVLFYGHMTNFYLYFIYLLLFRT